MSLSMGVFRPTVGSLFIKTPPEIAKKRAIINPPNFDNNCFQYSIFAALHPATSHLNNPYTYTKYVCQLDMTGIETPVSLSSIPKFESQNPSISVNVLVYEKNDLNPVYTSKFLNERPHHINFLLLSKGDKFHYTLIKSLSRLVCDRTQSRDTYTYIYKSYLYSAYKFNRVTMRLRPTSVHTASIHSDTNSVSRIISRNAVGIQPRP